MKHIQPAIYSLFALIVVLLISCKKENSTYPTVEILLPDKAANFSFGDTILVVAKIENRNGGTGVQVLQGSSVMNFESRKIYDSGSEVHYEVYYQNKYLTTGSYDLKFTAYNGSNYRSDFVNIDLNELELKMEGLSLLLHQSMLMNIMATTNQSYSKSFSTTYGDIAYNSRADFGMAAPVTSGKLTAYERQLAVLYDVQPPMPPGSIQYRELLSKEELIFSFGEDNFVRGWNRNSQAEINFAIRNELEVMSACFGDNFLFIGAAQRGVQLYELLVLNPDNGAELKKADFPFPPGLVAALGNDRFIVISNDLGNTAVHVYHTSSNLATEYARIPNEMPLSVAMRSSTEVILSTDKSIYRFDVAQLQLPKLLHTFVAQDIAYNFANAETYYASGSEVLVESAGGVISSVYTAASYIDQIDLIFNK